MSKHRADLESLMQATLTDEAHNHTWNYWATRPMAVPPTWTPGQRVTGDCSKGVQYLCRWAKLPDPMRMGYGPYGNSTTLCLELTHLDLGDMEVGDIVTFGPHGDEHAAMVLALIKVNGKTVDLLLWSFGHQGAPNSYKLSQDGREYQLLRVLLGSTAHKTPAAVLRAKTGYWSWRQWRLGKGAWHGYGKRDKAVRPDVPLHIPRAWWVKLARSLPKQMRTRANAPTPSPG